MAHTHLLVDVATLGASQPSRTSTLRTYHHRLVRTTCRRIAGSGIDVHARRLPGVRSASNSACAIATSSRAADATGAAGAAVLGGGDTTPTHIAVPPLLVSGDGGGGRGGGLSCSPLGLPQTLALRFDSRPVARGG